MKESETIVRSNKKAKSRSSTKLSNSSPTNRGNGTTDRESFDKQTKKTKAMMGSGNSKTQSTQEPSSRKGSPKKNKQSPELRPRRRASQTYFFKYQLARNPLKAEEEDLKLALLASLQQCENGVKDDKPIKLEKKIAELATDKSNGSKIKRPVGRPPKNHRLLVELNNGKKDKLTSSKKICTNQTNDNKRRGSVESSSSTEGSSVRDEEKKLKKKKKSDHRRDGLLTSCSLQKVDRMKKSDKSRGNVSSSITNNDLVSVQNKIKKAKKLLQNKNKTTNNITGKYSAMRKFPSNSLTNKSRGTSLLSPIKSSVERSKSKSTAKHLNHSNPSTANLNTTSRNQLFIPYSPYTPLMKAEPLDEDYLKKYKPETEEFLTFICFRTTAPNNIIPACSEQSNGVDSDTDNSTTPTVNSNQIGNNNNNNRIIANKQVPNDLYNLRHYPNSVHNKLTNMNISPTINIEHNSPTNHRRPTRQSPRLASSNRKISENDNSNHNMGTSTTACDLSITYEEDMKRASIALEDMAQEINSSDGITMNEVAQNSPDCISKLSSSPYKNNKHLVKGLMTREFAGAFADEETIFESISNHKL